MADLYIQRRRGSGSWVSFEERGFRGRDVDNEIHLIDGWWVSYPFEPEHLPEAIQTALAFKSQFMSGARFRIVNERGDVVWVEEAGFAPAGPVTSTPQEESMADQSQQPLHVPRETLIETLQVNLDAEVAERKKAQDAITARRSAAQDAVASLSSDELLNLVQKYVTSDLDAIVTMVEDATKTGRLKSSDQKAGPKESSLEKWVRVLGLATDESIEVKPTDPVYALL